MADQLIQGQKDSVTMAEKADKAAIERFVEKATRGDRDAIYSLCQAIARSVLFRISCRLKNQMDAEDAAQEVLIRVCSKIGEVKDAKAFGGWLNSIIINETNRYVTKNAKHTAVMDIDDYLEVAVDDADEFLPDDFAIKEEDSKALMEIVNQLPTRQWEAIMLHYYEEMTVTETAAAMGVTKQSVARHLVLAREKIKNSIQIQSKKLGKMYSFTFLPLGGLLTQVFRQESAQIAPVGEAWMTNIINQAGVTATAAGGIAGLIGTVAKVTATIVAATAIGAGLWVTYEPSETVSYTIERPVSIEATGTVQFSGGEPGYEYINPTDVAVQTDSIYGDLTIYDWRITKVNGTGVIYSGKGGDASAALAELSWRGEAGEYLLIFSLGDSLGGKYTLSRTFFIGWTNSS